MTTEKLFSIRLICVVSMFCVTDAEAHPLPDGVIMRGVQFVLQPDAVLVDYRVGFSDKTLRDRLAGYGTGESDKDKVEDLLPTCREILFPQIAQGLVVSVDGIKQVVEPVEAAIVERHHVRLQFTYRIDVSVTNDLRRIEIHDDNFRRAAGYHLMAIKGRGTLISDASDPPTTGRVRAIPLAEMSEAEREAAFRVSANFFLPTSDK